jgi:acyl-CoA synthetase (AMP-forming)/AMP-acid ligase II
VACFLVINQECNLTDDDLRTFISDKLPRYTWPSKVYHLDSMPLTSAGKIDRKTLITLVKN